jgi:hypothetical protein
VDTVKVAVRRISLLSLAKFGCLLGAVAAFLPSVLCGLGSLVLARLLHGWLESWQEVDISVLGREIARFDPVHLLGLDKLLELLRILTAASAPVLILAVLVLALVSGALLAVVVSLVGLAYNLLAGVSGGLVVEMQAIREGTGADSDQSSPAV